MEIFDQKEWEKIIQEPTWYRAVPYVWKNINDLYKKNIALCEPEVERITDFFEDNLEKNNIALASCGNDQDRDRLPIDTVVIHHTSMSPGLTKERLSAIDLLRLYAPEFARKEDGQSVWSGHLRDGRQVFWPYHWIVRSDGVVERLLEDHEIGWHAGNWNVNCRSIAIVLDNDYENSSPSEKELNAVASVICAHYADVSTERIVGHREINSKTTCPSNFFLSSPSGVGWKEVLVEKIQSLRPAGRRGV